MQTQITASNCLSTEFNDRVNCPFNLTTSQAVFLHGSYRCVSIGTILCRQTHFTFSLFPAESLASTRESCLRSWQRPRRERWRWDEGSCWFIENSKAPPMQLSGSGFIMSCSTAIWKHSNRSRPNVAHTWWLNTWRPPPCLPPKPLLFALLASQILTYKHLRQTSAFDICLLERLAFVASR